MRDFLHQHMDKIFLFLILILYIFLSHSLILYEPQIWPDEAYLADVAGNILNNGRWGTDLWGDAIAGTRQLLSWYPPVYLKTLATWFNLSGVSIINQRILSEIFGAIFLVVLYFFTVDFYLEGSFKKKKFIGLSLILILIFDNAFLRSSRIGRTEILVVLLGFLSLYLSKLAQKTNRNSFAVLCGLMLGLASLTHFMGIFFLILVIIDFFFYQHSKQNNSRFFHTIFAFVLPVLIWIVWILPNIANLLKQLSLQSSFRSLVISYTESVFKYSPSEQKAIYIIYILLSIICLLSIFKKKERINVFFSLGILGGWFICLYGKLEWYTIYIITFLYPYVIVNIFNNSFGKRFILTSVLLLILFAINVRIYFNYLNFYSGKKDSYYKFGQEIKNKIDEGKTIYLSTTPDLYFLLRGRNILYEFPNVQPTEKEYMDLLNDSDYMIINFHLERLFVGNLLDKYIELNRFKEYQVNEDGLYNAQIIELVPKSVRKLPNYD